MGQIRTAFAVPLYWDQLENCEVLNSKLIDLFCDKAKVASYKNPNPYTQRNDALFESRFDLFSWNEPIIKMLSDFCCSRVIKCIAELNGYDSATLSRIQLGADSWFHITENTGYFSIHNHPMASWSGVYCVSRGEPDPAVKNNGYLSFINPFIQNTMFVDAGNAQMMAPFSQAGIGYDLQPGQLVLFPSWLLHEVKPFIGTGRRVTVAFNCWFHLK